MDLRSLQTFVQVAESGSFSRAGARLGYSQPTVSVHIRQLEEELGVKLFDRIGHAVRLTDRGRGLLRHAQQICRDCQQLQQSVSQQNTIRGMVRLATAQSLCGPLVAQSFSRLRAACPELRLELTTAGTTDLFRMLDHNDADMVCTLDSHIYNTNYITAQEEQIGVHFVVPAGSPLAQQDRLTMTDLTRQQWLLTEQGMSYRRQLDEWLAQFSIALEPVLENGSADLLCELVEQGMGVSFLPDYVTAKAVRRGAVVRLEAEGFAPALWMQVLYRREKWVSESMEAVLQQLTAVRLAEEGTLANIPSGML